MRRTYGIDHKTNPELIPMFRIPGPYSQDGYILHKAHWHMKNTKNSLKTGENNKSIKGHIIKHKNSVTKTNERMSSHSRSYNVQEIQSTASLQSARLAWANKMRGDNPYARSNLVSIQHQW